MTPLIRRLILAFSLLGFGASVASTVVHYRLLAEPGYTSFCDVGSTVSCTQAYLSRYGSVAGVPVALAGAVFFGLTLILAGSAGEGRSKTFRENVPGYVFALSTVGLAAVIYLAYASFFVLKTICLLCVATYVAVGGLFVLAGTATSFPMTRLPGRAARDMSELLRNPAALAVALVFLLGSGLAVAFFPREGVPVPTDPAAAASAGSSSQMSEFDQWYASQPRVQVPIEREGARVLVVKFNDYQCPPCRQTYMEYESIFKKYAGSHPGAVRYVSRDYPLDPECNVDTPNGGHLAGCEAAVAVRLARRGGKAEALERFLFTNQEAMSPVMVRQAARDVGGITDFDAEYARILEEVKADIALGGLLGVRATPTFFINGVKVQGGLQPQFFEAAIAYELRQAGQ